MTVRKEQCYAITYIDEFNNRKIIVWDNQLCIFKTKVAARKFEVEFLTPSIKSRLENGYLIKKGWFSDKYLPLTSEEKRMMTRVLSTMLVMTIKTMELGVER